MATVVIYATIFVAGIVSVIEYKGDTFRTNEKNVNFELMDFHTEEGEGLQLRLETDQLRDWHKPSTTWSMTAPIEE